MGATVSTTIPSGLQGLAVLLGHTGVRAYLQAIRSLPTSTEVILTRTLLTTQAWEPRAWPLRLQLHRGRSGLTTTTKGTEETKGVPASVIYVTSMGILLAHVRATRRIINPI